MCHEDIQHSHDEASLCFTIEEPAGVRAIHRKHFTDADRTLIWDRLQCGESLHQIGQQLATRHSPVRQVLARAGGIRPPSRHRSDRALTLAEREEISRSVALGRSLRAVADQLHRAPSTISREIQRNGGRERHRANHADERAWHCACRPKTCKLSLHPALAKRVAAKLQKRWSPVQIAGCPHICLRDRVGWEIFDIASLMVQDCRQADFG